MTNIKSLSRWLLPLMPLAAVVLVASGQVTNTGTKPAMLMVSPTLAGDTGDTNTPDCSGFGTCHVTLSEPGNANSAATWSVGGVSLDDNPAAETFTPNHGTIKPGQTITIKVTNMTCDPDALWVFGGGSTKSGLPVGAAVLYTCG